MKLFIPLSLDSNLARIDAANDSFALQLSAAAAALNEAYRLFWSGGDEEIVARLNHIGPAKVQETFEKHSASATGLNALIDLAARPDLVRHRAIDTPARPVAWDAEEESFVIAQPEPEEPEP